MNRGQYSMNSKIENVAVDDRQLEEVVGDGDEVRDAGQNCVGHNVY